MHRYHVYNVFYFITVHCTLLQCIVHYYSALHYNCIVQANLDRCSSNDLVGKGTDGAQTQQTDDSRKSDWLQTGKYFSPISGKYSTMWRQIPSRANIHLWPDHKYGWLTNIWEGLMKSRNRQIRKSWNVNYSGCFALLECFVDKTIDRRGTLDSKFRKTSQKKMKSFLSGIEWYTPLPPNLSMMVLSSQT